MEWWIAITIWRRVGDNDEMKRFTGNEKRTGHCTVRGYLWIIISFYSRASLSVVFVSFRLLSFLCDSSWRETRVDESELNNIFFSIATIRIKRTFTVFMNNFNYRHISADIIESVYNLNHIRSTNRWHYGTTLKKRLIRLARPNLHSADIIMRITKLQWLWTIQYRQPYC